MLPLSLLSAPFPAGCGRTALATGSDCGIVWQLMLFPLARTPPAAEPDAQGLGVAGSAVAVPALAVVGCVKIGIQPGARVPPAPAIGIAFAVGVAVPTGSLPPNL
jgi:hypothetical protein